jgi:hypothetical protein
MEGKSVGITSSWYCPLLTSFPLQYTVAYLGPTRFVVRGVVGHGFTSLRGFQAVKAAATMLRSCLRGSRGYT